ncbi:MAG: Bcr/CflA family multidrug efflux MFS transporter [Lentisphaerae bacterium]|nr:Bcr/CflA family multidrug efflux MFS transporter [Lentisphaerota bacterium]MCP4102244.1 Bcr/CflA family multidrug efflux MFS transporter [Lentisphaerota bacterium]
MIKYKDNIPIDIIILLGVLAALTPMALDMYLPALPIIAIDLKTSTTQAQFSVQAYLLGYAMGQFICGPLSDSYGRRPVLLGGLTVFTIITLTIFTTDSSFVFNSLRLLQGISGAAASIITLTLVKDIFKREKFARTMSLISLIMLGAPVVSPIIGSHVSAWFGWRYIFTTLSGIAFAALIFVIVRLPETHAKEMRQPFEFLKVHQNYLTVIKNKTAFCYMLSNAFALSGVFCFLTSGSIVLAKVYKLTQQQVGYMLGVNVLFSFAFTFSNSQLVCKVGSLKLLKIGLPVQLSSCIAMNIFNFGNIFGLWGLILTVGLYIGINTSNYSNALACALHELPENIVGTAAAFSGVLCFAVSPLVGGLLALFPVDSTKPMVVGMLLCSVASLLVFSAASPKGKVVI